MFRTFCLLPFLVQRCGSFECLPKHKIPDHFQYCVNEFPFHHPGEACKLYFHRRNPSLICLQLRIGRVNFYILQQSSLVRTFQLLTQEEFETLHFFVASPIFNDVRPDETFALFEFLRRYYPHFESPDIHRDLVAQRFFSKSANPVAALQRTMTQLMAIVRKFITFRYAIVRDAHEKGEAASLHEIQQKLALMRFYSERMHQHPVINHQKPVSNQDSGNRKGRKAENFFGNLNGQVRDELNKQVNFSDFDEYEFIDFQYFRFMVEQEKSLYESTSSVREGDKNLLAATEQLDTFYLLIKLDQMSQLMHYQRMSSLYEPGSPEHTRFLANTRHTLQIVGILRQSGFLQDPAIAIYCTFLDFITQDDPVKADRLSEAFGQLLEQHSDALPDARVRNLKVMLRSFWPARYRETKDRRFLEKIYANQLQQLQQLDGKGQLATTYFQSALLTALKLGETDWADGFIGQYRNRLSGLNEEQTRLLLIIAATAVLFGKKQFEMAAESLPHYLSYGAVEDIYVYAVAATLDVRIHYELNDLDADYGQAMMHTTCTRIRRDDTIPQHRREERLRFYSISKELYKLKELRGFDRKADIRPGLKKIRERLDREIVVDWEWLEDKWAELK